MIVYIVNDKLKKLLLVKDIKERSMIVQIVNDKLKKILLVKDIKERSMIVYIVNAEKNIACQGCSIKIYDCLARRRILFVCGKTPAGSGTSSILDKNIGF